MEPLLRGHVDILSTPLERPIANVDLNMKALIPNETPLFMKGHISVKIE